MIGTLTAGLHANSCTVLGPFEVADARATIVDRVAQHANDAVTAISPADPLVMELDLVAAFRAAGHDLLLPDDTRWREQLPDVAVGVTGAVLATATPAAFAGRGRSRSSTATSLVPPVHVCALRTRDVVASFAAAIDSLVPADLPSVLTWIGGPSRTGDLEMIATLGVHGPRVVEVVLVT